MIAAEPSPQGPVQFGRFQLIRRIGAGGMGEVFLAREDGVLSRACVVKKVLPDLVKNRAFVGRFIDEAKVVVRLDHPNVAKVYAMGEVAGEYFLAMEYVQGKTVSRFTRRLRERKQEMPLSLILHIGEQVCRGLAYAHDAPDDKGQPLHLVHRDLSPANVCISYAGDVKIIDFGAAQSTLKEEQTAPRVVIGNLTYMSPEQAKKQVVDRRADVYSTGVMLWELLAWKLLPQKGDPIERWRKAANPLWEPPSSLNPSIPKEVDAVVLKALAKEREARWKDARELGQQLQRLQQQLAPHGSPDRELGMLLTQAFRDEKRSEDEALRQTLIGRPQAESAGNKMVFVPPNALAFEHTAIEAPSGFTPEDDEVVTDPGIPPPFTRVTRDDLHTSRIGFGVSFRKPTDPGELSIVQEIEAMESGTEVAVPTVPAPPLGAVRREKLAGQFTEPVPPLPPLPEEEEPESPGLGRRLLIGAGLFLGATAVGFVGIWWWVTR